MSSTFQGKVAWITGGGSGIGRALALELTAQGAKVAVSGRREERLAAVVSEIEAAGGEGLAAPCDVTDEEQVRTAVDAVLERFGRLDLAIANAGFSVGGRVEELEIEAWEGQFDVNVFGAVRTARAALPALRETGGYLALVGSVAGYAHPPKNGPYAASKAAVAALGNVLWLELQGSGVSCTTLHPGFVESEIAQVDNAGVHHPDREDRRPAQLMWPADRAARVMLRAIAARRRERTFTGHGRFAVFLARVAPWLLFRILQRS